MDEDKGWDEYDDCDDDELSDENEEDKKDEKNNEYINQKQYSSNNGYNKSNNNGYYGYNNNYSYGGPTKKYRKKGNKKYYSKENESQFTNKNRQYNKDLGSGYKNISHDFVNTNSNYMRNPNIDDNNHKNYNSNTYGKSRSYANRDKNKNNWGFYGGGKKIENEVVSKPMFINSKLKNNGNPEGNFVKIDVNPEEKKHFSLTNIGEIIISLIQYCQLNLFWLGKSQKKKLKIVRKKQMKIRIMKLNQKHIIIIVSIMTILAHCHGDQVQGHISGRGEVVDIKRIIITKHIEAIKKIIVIFIIAGKIIIKIDIL